MTQIRAVAFLFGCVCISVGFGLYSVPAGVIALGIVSLYLAGR